MEDDNKTNADMQDEQKSICNGIKARLRAKYSGIICYFKMGHRWKLKRETKIVNEILEYNKTKIV